MPVRIGVAGLGFMGSTHLNAFKRVKGAIVSAVATSDPRSRAGDLRHIGGNLNQEGVLHDFSKVRQYAHWRELVEDGELDAIDICLPTMLHTEVTLAALAGGKHVLCEKPMALTAGECDTVVAAAQQHRRVLMIGQVLRFWPEYEYLAQFLRENGNLPVEHGVFGRRCALPDWSLWLPEEQQSGGAVLDLLVHDLDQVLHLFGVPEQVAAKTLGPVDTIKAEMMYAGGWKVDLEGGWFPAGEPFEMTFRVETNEERLELCGAGLQRNRQGGTREAIHLPAADAYERELAYFVECCESGCYPERCPPSASAQAVKLALLLKQARERGGEPLPCVL